MKKVKSIEEFFSSLNSWQSELSVLRRLLLTTNLKEGLKWGVPTYTIEGKNVVSFTGFKKHFALWFFNGVFLNDKSRILTNAQEGKTKALRQWRFFDINDIDEELILAYVEEAIQNELEGKQISVVRDKTFKMAPRLKVELKNNIILFKNYSLLTLGRQKEYLNYILEAKRDVTKEKRILKITSLINKGVGLNDKYKNC